MDSRFSHNLRTREFFISFIDKLTTEQLNEIPQGFSNNIIWNICHSMTSQQGLVYGLSLVDQQIPKELALRFRNGTKPEGFIQEKEINEFKEMLVPLIKKTSDDYDQGVFKEFKPYTTSTGYTMNDIEDAIQMNNIHEGLHLGYAMAILKAIH
ncbi:DinB family protein [Nonlabens ponticola]|uniref:DinB family protein n=1 Tax=Nonlabens ponticola TaxID=2496866 RepID=A0A3S9MW79_9FLAO|nr:DinB family protein [Nonlabens ponticola]AZQ43389.1 DinB family protein [Nonlabens ponticola]